MPSLHRRTRIPGALARGLAAGGALLALVLVPSASGSDHTIGQLNSELGRQQSRQQQLEASLGSLSQLISSLSVQISIVQSREAAVQNQLAKDRARLIVAKAALMREKRRV